MSANLALNPSRSSHLSDTGAGDRRGLFGRALLGAGLLAAGATLMGASQPARAALDDPRERVRQRRLPNVPLLTHEGRVVRFYDDIVRDRQVVINVMYTSCSNICGPATRKLVEARHHLGSRTRDLHFVSLTLTPLTDTPAELAAYRRAHGIDGRDGDWTFLTGSVANVERVAKALGLMSQDPADDLLSHSGAAVVGDERRVQWGHANTLTSGRGIARMIRFELV
ncbi:SCO family protein [Leptothrix discophora]|uniref:SCO family protein n=1 Tax=Leptothrix discophora TaxID=89 RepID=A0ABT9G5A9_LEPDI|nr:SCO family protein [Leptothrix discophora]MDP4301457.1 SCO family protein [Leptothrix discophora]